MRVYSTIMTLFGEPELSTESDEIQTLSCKDTLPHLRVPPCPFQELLQAEWEDVSIWKSCPQGAQHPGLWRKLQFRIQAARVTSTPATLSVAKCWGLDCLSCCRIMARLSFRCVGEKCLKGSRSSINLGSSPFRGLSRAAGREESGKDT